MKRLLLADKLALAGGAVVVAAAAAASLLVRAGLGVAPAFALGATAGLVVVWGALKLLWRPVGASLQAVTDGVRSFHDGDFSLRLAIDRGDEVGELAGLYNDMADALREQRTGVYQRELLFDTLLQGAPMAIALVAETGRVAYSNAAARRLLAHGKRLAGRALPEALSEAPSELARAIERGGDALVTLPSGQGMGETYRVEGRDFVLGTQRHRLVVVERLTQELRRQEIETWKKAIRVMSHELNNSLAPISSLLHSARHVGRAPERAHRQDEILALVEERVRHLASFLSAYAEFARLPEPRKEPVGWTAFLAEAREVSPFRLIGEPPGAPGFFDPVQMQQVLINLLKNAAESGSPPDEIAVAVEEAPGGGALLHVLDRGQGLTDEEMTTALVPFHSKKPSGSGLGLPLSAEVLAAHGGTLTLRRRSGGGLAVTCFLPPGPRAGS